MSYRPRWWFGEDGQHDNTGIILRHGIDDDTLLLEYTPMLAVGHYYAGDRWRQ